MTKKRLTISLSEEVYELLVERSKKAGLSKSAFLTTLISEKKKGA